MRPRLVVLGGGRMGEALVAGLIASGWAPAGALAVVEERADQRLGLAERHPGLGVTEAVPAGDGLVLAVKPSEAERAARAAAGIGFERVLSIVAGLTLAQLEGWLGGGVGVVRAMANTPALIGAGAAAIAGGAAASGQTLDWAEGILGAVGTVVRLPEHQLDAVTGLSGSGPAYLCLVAEALVEAGVAAGLSREVSRSLSLQTLLGSARLLAETGQEPEVWRAAVTSPGGTTAAGLRVLESRATRSAFIEAVAAATERSRQLARTTSLASPGGLQSPQAERGDSTETGTAWQGPLPHGD